MTGPQRPVRIAVIGAGSMGSLHARVVHESADAQLSCVIDPDPLVGRALAARHGRPWFPTLDRADLIDAVIVASSTETHYSWFNEVVHLGKPVLVEKPLSTDLSESRAMVEAAAATGVPLMCGFVERFNPAFLRAREILEAPLYFQAIRHAPYASRVRSGVAHDAVIHDADLAIQVFGTQPETVSARFGYFHPDSAPGAEDVADVHLEFEGGAIAMLSASRIMQRKIRTIAIGELHRHLEIDLAFEQVTVYRQDEYGQSPMPASSRTAIELPTLTRRREPLAGQLEHLVALVRGAVDPDAERRTVLPAHEAVAAALAGNSAVSLIR